MKTLRFLVACLLAVALPLQALAAVLPDGCHHSDDALVSHSHDEMHDELHDEMHHEAHDMEAAHEHTHTQDHASSQDNSCKHCAPCCLGVAVLPGLPGFNPPVLAQSTRPWTSPVILSVSPRLFERPPKRFAV